MNNQGTNNQFIIIEDLYAQADAIESLTDLSVDETTEAELIGGGICGELKGAIAQVDSIANERV